MSKVLISPEAMEEMRNWDVEIDLATWRSILTNTDYPLISFGISSSEAIKRWRKCFTNKAVIANNGLCICEMSTLMSRGCQCDGK